MSSQEKICLECGSIVRHQEGFAVPHLAGFFRYCPGGGFPEKAERQAITDLDSIKRAREAARVAWTL